MNNKGEAKPRNWLIGLLIFGLVIAGVMAMLSQVGTDLNGDTSTFNNTFNKLNEIRNSTDSIDDEISSSRDSVGVLGFLNAMIGSSWVTMKMLFTSFTFINDIFYATQGLFGVPVWVTSTIVSIITIIIVFAVLRAILQTDQI